MDIWAGMFAPKGTPKEIVDKLAQALDKALDDPAVVKRVSELGGSIPPKAERNPEKFATFVRAEIDRWSPILKQAAAAAKK
jgi:tripartite-type tricarboxylate transporter receptor subunit TctC